MDRLTWVRIESGFFRHRKVLDLPLTSKLLFLGGLCYSAENGTDGHVSRSALRVLAAELDVKATAARHLEDAGLWHKQADGHDIHDYLVYQPSAEQERQRRQEHAERMKQWRDKKTRRAVSRDMSHEQSQPPPRDASQNMSVTLSPNPNPNPIDKSSSSEPLVGVAGSEEEDFATVEAKRRYAARQGEPVNNPAAWIARTADAIRNEPAAPPPAPSRPLVIQRPDCATCDGLSLVEADDNGYVACPDCTETRSA